MQKLTLKNRDTQDTLFFSSLRGQNCHFSSDAEPGHGPSGIGGELSGYLWFPRAGSHTPLLSYLGEPGASTAPPQRGR
jgi:hypothetical protein